MTIAPSMSATPYEAAVKAAIAFISGDGTTVERINQAGLTLVTSIHPIMSAVYNGIMLAEKYFPPGTASEHRRWRLVVEHGWDPVQVAAMELWLRAADTPARDRQVFWANLQHKVAGERWGLHKWSKEFGGPKTADELHRAYLDCHDQSDPMRPNPFIAAFGPKRKSTRVKKVCRNVPAWTGRDLGQLSIALVDIYSLSDRASIDAAEKIYASLTRKYRRFSGRDRDLLRDWLTRETAR